MAFLLEVRGAIRKKSRIDKMKTDRVKNRGDREGGGGQARRRRTTDSSSSSPAMARGGSSDMNEVIPAGGGLSSSGIRRDRRTRRGNEREEDRGMSHASAEGRRRGEEEVQRGGRGLSLRGRRYEVSNTIDRRLDLGSERSILTRDLRLLREAYYETQWNSKAALSRGEPQV